MSARASNESREVAIVGGGIGGLTLALSLHAAGLKPCVFERAPRLIEAGAGIQLSPNAMRVIRALGLEDALMPFAFAPEALEMCDGVSGRNVFSIGAQQGRWGAPYLHLHRTDLVAVLEQALEARVPGALTTDAEVTAIKDDGERVTLSLGDQVHVADLAVGADGIHSTVRRGLFGNAGAQFTGQLAWRATVPIEKLGANLPPPTACVWTGGGRHAVTYRVRGGQVANFVGVVEREDWQGESWTEAGTREDVLADFDGWRPEITAIIEAADRHYRWALHDRPPLPQWHRGRVGLLGDACHPVLPFLAQGAAMAIEDGWVLAAMLAQDLPVDAALAAYARARRQRVQRVYEGARHNAELFHLAQTPRRAGTRAILKLGGRLLPGVARSRLDWLYGDDVTAHFPLRA
ncbi:MAG: FAD-dependent monooxygenase [Pseudomonadota bacterium]